MKNILYIISTLKKTAPVNVLYNIIKNLDRTEYNPIILTLSKEKKNSVIKDFEALNITIKSLDLNNYFGYFEAGIKITKAVKQINPDIIHTHCFRSTLFSALFLRKFKRIATIHCDYDIDFVLTYGKILGFIMAKLMDYSLKKTDRRIACSEYLKNIINEKKNFTVEAINNGIDTKIFHPVTDKKVLREKLSLPLDKTLWIWVGVLTPGKSPLTLINGIKNSDSNTNYFIFCGDGVLKEKIVEETKNMGNILLTGYIDNIQEYLQASDYYISTSLSEGLPLSVLEGMACGLPVILSDIPQHEFLFKSNIGLLYPVNDSEQLKGCISKILLSETDKLKANAINTVKNYFDSSLMSQEYQNLYKISGINKCKLENYDK